MIGGLGWGHHLSDVGMKDGSRGEELTFGLVYDFLLRVDGRESLSEDAISPELGEHPHVEHPY